MANNITEFLAAIWSDWWSRMTGLASLAVPVVAYILGTNEKELWWAVAYTFLLVSAFRVWQLERQKPGPHVMVEYETTRPDLKNFKEWEQWQAKGKSESDIPLKNLSDIAAFDVKIADISLGQTIVTFPVIPMVVKDNPVIVQATIEQFSTPSCHDLGEFLRAAWEANGLAVLKVPINVSYRDRHGRKFETVCEIEYSAYLTKTYHKRYDLVVHKVKWLAGLHKLLITSS